MNKSKKIRHGLTFHSNKFYKFRAKKDKIQQIIQSYKKLPNKSFDHRQETKQPNRYLSIPGIQSLDSKIFGPMKKINRRLLELSLIIQFLNAKEKFTTIFMLNKYFYRMVYSGYGHHSLFYQSKDLSWNQQQLTSERAYQIIKRFNHFKGIKFLKLKSWFDAKILRLIDFHIEEIKTIVCCFFDQQNKVSEDFYSKICDQDSQRLIETLPGDSALKLFAERGFKNLFYQTLQKVKLEIQPSCIFQCIKKATTSGSFRILEQIFQIFYVDQKYPLIQFIQAVRKEEINQQQVCFTKVQFYQQYKPNLDNFYKLMAKNSLNQKLSKQNQQNKKISSIQQKSNQILEKACEIGNLKIVQILVANKFRVNPSILNFQQQQTPLRIAALKGHSNIVSFILQQGANPNTFGRFYDTPLRAAVFSQDINSVKMLLNAKADPNFFQQQSKPIKKLGQKVIAQKIKEQGGQINFSQSYASLKYYFNSPLRQAVLLQNSTIVKQLQKAGAQLYYDTISGRISEYQAAESGLPQLMIFVLKNNGNPNMINYPNLDTPLWIATQKGFYETMKILIGYGAKAQQVGKGKQSPIMTAKRRNDKQALDILTSFQASFAVQGQRFLFLSK